MVKHLCVLYIHDRIRADFAATSQILIQHRAPDEQMRLVEEILAPLKSRYVHLTYDEHDEVTANTQAVTHAAFLRYLSNN